MIPQGEQSGGDATHERKDADVIGLFMIVGLLLLILGICFLVCWGILHLFNRERDAQDRRPHSPGAAQVAAFPQPRLLVHPGSERAKVQAAERTQLETYGWVDRPAGVVRVPIERAMQLVVERGLPEVGVGETRLQLMQSRSQIDLSPNETSPLPTPEATP
jgi:hypothetical protein